MRTRLWLNAQRRRSCLHTSWTQTRRCTLWLLFESKAKVNVSCSSLSKRAQRTTSENFHITIAEWTPIELTSFFLHPHLHTYSHHCGNSTDISAIRISPPYQWSHQVINKKSQSLGDIFHRFPCTRKPIVSKRESLTLMFAIQLRSQSGLHRTLLM